MTSWPVPSSSTIIVGDELVGVRVLRLGAWVSKGHGRCRPQKGGGAGSDGQPSRAGGSTSSERGGGGAAERMVLGIRLAWTGVMGATSQSLPFDWD